MVEFLTVFLGLSTGLHTIELSVAGPVAAVEIQLDGEELTTLTTPPWVFECDLGTPPLPHDLVAIARAADGHEIHRAEQWINMTAGRAVAMLAVDSDATGQAQSLRVDWQSIGEAEPEQIQATFDGQSLEVSDPNQIPLPAHDRRDFHYVSADVEFSGVQRDRREAQLGGLRTARLSTELTSVVIHLEGRSRLPSRARMQSWFRKRDQPLSIHGVEKGLTELIIVRTPGAQVVLDHLAQEVLRRGYQPNKMTRPLPTGTPGSPGWWLYWDPAEFFTGRPEAVDQRIQNLHGPLTSLRQFARFSDRVRLRFLSPRPGPLVPTGLTSEMFLHSPTYSGAEGGLSWLVQKQQPMQFDARVREAVAVAGLRARASHQRRAVLLIRASPAAQDSSASSAADVRELLRALQVPLYVWSFGELDPEWGDATALGDPDQPGAVVQRLERAAAELRQDLKAQRVVWLKGRHLPQQIEISKAARGVRMAG